MARNNLFQDFISMFLALSILVVFIPIFQEMGVNYSFMQLFIFAIILIFIVGIILWIKERKLLMVKK